MPTNNSTLEENTEENTEENETPIIASQSLSAVMGAAFTSGFVGGVTGSGLAVMLGSGVCIAVSFASGNSFYVTALASGISMGLVGGGFGSIWSGIAAYGTFRSELTSFVSTLSNIGVCAGVGVDEALFWTTALADPSGILFQQRNSILLGLLAANVAGGGVVGGAATSVTVGAIHKVSSCWASWFSRPKELNETSTFLPENMAPTPTIAP